MTPRSRRWRWWAAAIAAAIALWISARTRRAYDAGSPAERGTAGPVRRPSTLRAGAPPALPPEDDAGAGQPAIRADVHRPPPPEAIGSPQPAAPPGQDTGLVFRAEPPGGGALERAKAAAAPPPPSHSGAPAPIGPIANVRPPPEPIGAEPARSAGDQDSGLVFSDQPQRPIEAADKR